MSTSKPSSDNIVTACYAETLLMVTLGYACKDNHQNGDGNVINSFKKAIKRNVIGVMDKPIGTAPSHVNSEFTDFKSGSNNLILKKHKRHNHYIIYINEVLEDWIVKIGNTKNINRPYQSAQTFKEEMKASGLLQNKRLIKYFDDIRRANPESFKTIVKWVNHINSHQN
jgi:hypothetical protein